MKSAVALLMTIAALAAVPAGVGAQPLTSTGLGSIASIDPSWTFRFGNTGSYGNAFVLDRPGNVPGSYQWIYGTPSGSTTGGAPDQTLTRFSYWVRTTFSGITSFSYRCAVDDQFANFGSLRINGTTVDGAGCDAYTLNNVFTVSNLSSGTNTLEFNWGGNGITDGVIIDIKSPQVVPEPGTWGLMAMGLVGLLGVARRRRA
jgi:hypothetical protein